MVISMAIEVSRPGTYVQQEPLRRGSALSRRSPSAVAGSARQRAAPTPIEATARCAP